MGVYIFRSIHGPYIKVGHYAGQNVYSRVAHRGFYSCVCPDEIRDRVSVSDMELIAWYPTLTRRDEASVKKKWRSSRIYKSEWFSNSLLDEIKIFLDSLDTDMSETCNLDEALATRRRL